LKIYRATKKENGKWGNVEELPFNSDHFNTAHPMLNAEETEMYFASDRPGGSGGSDLWKVSLTEDGFGTPVNLGATINTEGRETFPFMAADNVLYFSSDGRPGLGGLDVFAVQIKADGTYTDIQNVGEPINSTWDDFAYIIDADTRQGFFSSNRPGAIGNDDIYRFTETRALLLECLQNLEVKVIDAETGQVIEGALISLFDGHRNLTNEATQSGMDYITMLTAEECGTFFRVQASAEDYQSNSAGALLKDEIGGVTQLEIALEPAKVKVEKGDDLFKKFNLNPIYFDLDKSNIRLDAAEELAKILAVLEEYPAMKIDIRSHTDSRASHAYNDRLSERRAQSTRQWLIDQGIEANRLTAKGYGERQLINQCADGVKCSEEDHQANRRSEFIVMEL
ncbi:MAG TPA: OmpA family protein, partial [Aequorivita sp.]|nr:OmpA family protein [Aequorivita sp.]